MKIIGIFKKIIHKTINTYPLFGWILLVYPLQKFIYTIGYHSRWFLILDKKFKGLHLGSGGLVIEGYLNIDGNPAAYCDVVGSVEKIFLKDNSVECIYTSHVFEHIPRARTAKVLAEWFRVLAPGGRLYICVPDLEALSRIYLDGLDQYDRDLLVQSRVDKACNVIFGGQGNRYDFHFYGYSVQTLKLLLKQVGFVAVERFDRASIKEFPSIDASFANMEGTPISLNLVAVK